MNAKSRIPIAIRLMTACAVLALVAFGSSASASVVRIHFSGAPGSGYADLTLGAADSSDLIDASHAPLAITNATGTFGGATITGVLAPNPIPPPPGETLIPGSYSLFSIPGYGDHDGVTYDNLFYPNGSPQICYIDGLGFVFPFSGGMFDLLGVMFTLDNGNFLDLWSFGVVDPNAGIFPPFLSGLTYGMKVIQPNAAGGYDVLAFPPFASVSVPEPDFLWLFGVAAFALLAWRRAVEARKRALQNV